MTIDDARENFMSDVYNTLDFLPTNNEANRIIDSFDRVTSGLNQQPCDDNWRFYYNHGYAQAKRDLSCEDCISRQAVDELSKELVHTTRDKADFLCNFWEGLQKLPSVTPKEKIGYCKDCKWWKDNDGVYRRGIGAESKCPINCKKVYEGNGYCFMFETQESEEI